MDAIVTTKIEERKIRDDKTFGLKICTKLDKYRNQHIGNGSKVFCLHYRTHDTEDRSGSSTCSEGIITDCQKTMMLGKGEVTHYAAKNTSVIL